ncbi:hypothetical protein [Chitinibacter sp. GC72]|uniref:phage tail terminator protein n=1 Tax=Chitinibacter sp. GC72 TaxID=1526917 RepID=UPI0012F79F5D|nr:hypothetical protein [Chitinibacter sp. GC72]
MKIKPIIEYLKAQCPLLKSVGGAADYAEGKKLLKHQLPAAFVIPLGDIDGPNSVVGEVHQERRTAFALIFAQSNLKKAGGVDDVDELQQLRAQVRDALLGWLPPECDQAIEAAGGKLLDFDDAVLWWQDDYATGYAIYSQ